jgi:hypothetical protein
MSSWQVTVDLVGVELTDEQREHLVDELADAGAAVGTRPGRLSVTLSVEAEDPATAFDVGLDRVYAAVLPMATPGAAIAGGELLADEEADQRLAGPAFPELVGIAEVAELLGVTRQRASELQHRAGFPRPVALLRSGPVWRKGDLSSFAATWTRKPGRPRRTKPIPAEELRERQ